MAGIVSLTSGLLLLSPRCLVVRWFVGFISGAVILVLCAVLLGAPLWGKSEFTVLWAFQTSALSVAPVAIILGSHFGSWAELVLGCSTKSFVERQVALPAVGALAGGWVGAAFTLLDWQSPWIEFPFPVAAGTCLGFLSGIVAFVVNEILTTSHIRKTKRRVPVENVAPHERLS